MCNLLNKISNHCFGKLIYCFIFIIIALDVYGVYDLNKDDARQTKSYKNETLSGEEYYEAGLKGELMDSESKREPLLLSSLKLVSKKPHGFSLGGAYKDVNGDIWFVKAGQKPVDEYLGSKVMDLLIGPLSPEVRLLPDAPGYVASKLLPGFLTKAEVMKDPNHKPIVGDDKLLVAMDLMGLGDRSDYNLGYIDMGDRLEAARVDFDHSFCYYEVPFIGKYTDEALESIVDIPDEMILYVLGDAYNYLWETGVLLHYEMYKDLGTKLIARMHKLRGLDKNLDVNLRDIFMNAINNGKLEIISLLLDNGADINMEDEWGDTPLHRAINNRKIEVISLLLDRGADINMKGHWEDTPLHRAVDTQQPKVVNLLLGKGADVNEQDVDGRRLLHVAVGRGRPESVRLLLDNGADVNLKDKHGRTALDVAKEKGNTEIISLLEERASGYSGL